MARRRTVAQRHHQRLEGLPHRRGRARDRERDHQAGLGRADAPADHRHSRPLIEAGATGAESPADAAREAEVVVTIVSDPRALQAVTEGPDGVAAGAGADTTVMQMSTVGPDPVARLASALPEGAGLLDAPV